MFAPPAHQPACMLLPSALAKACCTCLMFSIPLCCSCLSPSLMCFWSALFSNLLRQQRLLFLFFPVRETLVNSCCFACCLLSGIREGALWEGDLLYLLFFNLKQIVMGLATAEPCLARCVCFSFLFFLFLTWLEFPLLLGSPKVFRGLVLADWSI